MLPIELRAALSLGAVFSLRLLGLFMILPVFSLYADSLTGNTPLLTGIAIGAYGLTQAILQIPFGMLSDRIGRKKVMVIGLLIFAFGSVVAALSDSIWWVIAGRALQGAGAISAAVMALLADLTSEESRSRAMAIFGGSIGFSFTLALVAGPVLNHWIGVPGIFWLTGGLALLGIILTLQWVPKPESQQLYQRPEGFQVQLKLVLTDPQLLRLDFGILILHMLITATFVALPLVLRDTIGLDSAQHGWVYLSMVMVGVLGMVPALRWAAKNNKEKELFLISITVLAIAELSLFLFHSNLQQILFSLALFFLAFNTLEATLPSMASKLAPAECKGAAMGVYSSSQFLGAFLGGATGGTLLGMFGASSVFMVCAILVVIWRVVASGMQRPGKR